MKKIAIKHKNLPTSVICLTSDQSWRSPFLYNGDSAVSLTEEEIYENAAQAVRELAEAEKELRLAQQRVESLRLFVIELVKPEQLSVVNG